MSEPFQPEDLSPFEARLAELLPRPAQIGRDEILFEAGRQEAYREQRRVLHKWYAVSAALLVVVCGQWLWLTDHGTTGGVPAIADVPAATEEPLSPSDLQLAEDGSENNSPAATSSDSIAESAPSVPRPSMWEKLLPLPESTRSTIALGRDLTVGSSMRGIAYESFSIPKAGSMPAEDEPILSPMFRTHVSE